MDLVSNEPAGDIDIPHEAREMIDNGIYGLLDSEQKCMMIVPGRTEPLARKARERAISLSVNDNITPTVLDIGKIQKGDEEEAKKLNKLPEGIDKIVIMDLTGLDPDITIDETKRDQYRDKLQGLWRHDYHTKVIIIADSSYGREETEASLEVFDKVFGFIKGGGSGHLTKQTGGLCVDLTEFEECFQR